MVTRKLTSWQKKIISISLIAPKQVCGISESKVKTKALNWKKTIHSGLWNTFSRQRWVKKRVVDLDSRFMKRLLLLGKIKTGNMFNNTLNGMLRKHENYRYILYQRDLSCHLCGDCQNTWSLNIRR